MGGGAVPMRSNSWGAFTHDHADFSGHKTGREEKVSGKQNEILQAPVSTSRDCPDFPMSRAGKGAEGGQGTSDPGVWMR